MTLFLSRRFSRLGTLQVSLCLQKAIVISYSFHLVCEVGQMKGVRSFVEDLGRCFCRYLVQLCGAELRRASKQHSVNNNELHLEIQRPFKGKFGPLKRISESLTRIVEPLITKANESYGSMIQI